MEVIGGAVTMRATAETGPKHWVNKSRQHFSGWYLLVLPAGYCTILFASGAKVAKVPQVLVVTDQAGEAVVEDGVAMMATTTRLHRTMTRDNQEKAHTAPTNRSPRAGDLDLGPPH